MYSRYYHHISCQASEKVTRFLSLKNKEINVEKRDTSAKMYVHKDVQRRTIGATYLLRDLELSKGC